MRFVENPTETTGNTELGFSLLMMGGSRGNGKSTEQRRGHMQPQPE
jgi:hypothetical protein